MINLIDKVFKHPHLDSHWRVINFNDKDETFKLKNIAKDECTSVTMKQCLEMYAEDLEKMLSDSAFLMIKIEQEIETYKEQKKRADRAEKRWSELKEHFIKEKEQSFGISSWSRNNEMLELMEQLEEDGE